MTLQNLIWFIPLPPLLAFAVIILFTNKNKALSHTIAIASAAISWLLGMIIFFKAITTPEFGEKPFIGAFEWITSGAKSIKFGYQIDPLSAVVLFFVCWTVLMIFVYSVGYHNFGQPEGKHDKPGFPPEGAEIRAEKGKTALVPSVEPMYSRFFALISLFAFAMLLLVITDNLLVLYIGWEIMGFCSYALIGFWCQKESARKAMIKAFLTTRVGDVFMLLGIPALLNQTGTLNYREILSNQEVLSQLAGAISPVLGLSWAALIGILLFIGTVGKSAQFPLHIWLPDAMEGPTPVSAMIHAATMVSAGVYLVVRFFPLLSAGWEPGGVRTAPMLVMGFIGAFTAIFAATIAVAQNDIKRVLAYSTISQLGFMIAALGVGAFVAAAFHLVTHAFFKALLFLGSGSVIHGMEHGVLHTKEHVDPQDMLNMGGLRKKMPITFWTFLIGGFALAGFPIVTAGFWSKDEILTGAFNGGNMVIFITLAVAALLTAFYTMRQITLTFLGEPRTQAAAHAHESKPTMTLPLVVLSFFAVTAGWVGIPKAFPGLGGLIPNWFEEFVGSTYVLHHGEAHHSSVPLLTSLVVALGGLLLGWLVYRNRKEAVDPIRMPLGGLHSLLQNKYYIDELYQTLFIKPSSWFAEKISYALLDTKIIDGFLHGIGHLGEKLGGVLRTAIDLPVINGAGNQIAARTRQIGEAGSARQAGQVQKYMMLSIGVLAIAGLLFYYLVGLR
ncbi:MAG TPA: NADH-quinone oxidoreductase subunit L [Bellilinea sp.]|nr:NADH-quinone oxidoreductase subunit L [Bellilinea sp.]